MISTDDPPRVLTTDGALWALYKPAGMLVHATAEVGRPDIVSWAVAQAGAPAGLAPIHRLDVATSGIVLCSPDPALRGALGTAFADRTVHKTYEALVYGRTHKKGTIERPLADTRRQRPVDARTRYRRVAWLGGFTHLAVHPETGRKHQIRRHLRMIGHAIVGDRRYGPQRPRRVPGYPGRMWLHATSLTLPDGRTFEAPLPPVLANHLDLLASTLGSP